MDGIPCITETQLLSLANSNDIENTSSKDVFDEFTCRLYICFMDMFGWGRRGRECGGSKGGAGFV